MFSNPKKSKDFFYRHFTIDHLNHLEKINYSYTKSLLKNYETVYLKWHKDNWLEADICIEDKIGFDDENIVDTSMHFSYIGNNKISDMFCEIL